MAATVSGMVAAALLAIAAGQGDAPSAPTIFADGSLKPAIDAIAAAWSAHSGVTPTLVYASTGLLAKRIEAGVPADVFVATSPRWMEPLEKTHLVNGHTRQPIIGNDLVLIAPAESKLVLKIAPGFDLAGALAGGRLAVCAEALCPAGLYAHQALDALKVWPSVQPMLLRDPDGGSALAAVATGQAALGIVYAAEAKGEPKVKVVDTFAAATHEPIVFPIALTAATHNPDAARFQAFVRSGEATRILIGQGFTVLK